MYKHNAVALGRVACAAGVLLATVGGAWANGYVPWTPLTQDPHPDQPDKLGPPTWIGAGNVTMYAHTAGGGIAEYPVGFNDANQDTGDAAGNDSLQFQYGGVRLEHHVGPPAGSFEIYNGGGGGGGGGGTKNRTFNDVLLLVAVDAPLLDGEFSLSLRQSGQPTYTVLDRSHFAYYDPTPTGLNWATGRPSGNHADYLQDLDPGHPDPPAVVLGSFGASYRAELAYCFDKGMASVFALQGIDVAQDGSKGVDYIFEGLPGKAVFSLYGYRSSENRIKRTNQSVSQSVDPDGFTTFEVAPEPASVLLMSVGAVACLVRKRRGGKQ